MTRLIAYFFIFTLALQLYVNRDMFEFDAPKQVAVHTFEDTVESWSAELEESVPAVQVTPDVEGNCLPVAVELQRRIVETGRIAFIAIVEPPNLETAHAVVVYSSKVAGRLDSVIDNGYSTQNKVKPTDFLDTGVFGLYTGTCMGPDTSEGTCSHFGLAW